MFYTILHKPSGTWIPMFKSAQDRSYYYSFIDGADPGKKVDISKLTFDAAYKFNTKEKAVNALEDLLSKSRSTRSKADRQEDFEIEEHETWPIERLKLTNTTNAKVDTFRVHSVTNNWMCKSNTYCSKCGIYIPSEVQFISLYGHSLCPWCVEEMSIAVINSAKGFKDQEFIERLKVERFIGNI